MEQPDTSTTGTVVGFFEDQAAAQQAVRALHEAGFTSAHLGTAHPGTAETATASNPSSNQASVSDVTNTIARQTEELLDKLTDTLCAGTRESDFTTDHTNPASASTSSPAPTPDPVKPQDGLTLNEDLSHFVTGETGTSSEGAVVTVEAPGRQSEAEAILRNLGADV